MISAQSMVSTTESKKKDLLIFQGHLVKLLGKILRVVGGKNNYKMIDVLF